MYVTELENKKRNNPADLLTRPLINKNISPFESAGEFKHRSKTVLFKERPKITQIPPIKDFTPIDFLHLIQSSIPDELIASDNYSRICHLASFFNGSISSFFGFETRFNSERNHADYLVAISSHHGEKEALNSLLHSYKFQSLITHSPEWNNLRQFTIEWCKEGTALNKMIYGLWFEFDMTNEIDGLPIPSIFINTIPISNDYSADDEKYRWLSEKAIPLLMGKKLSQKVKSNFSRCIQKLPNDTYLIDVGIMLSRSSSDIRLMFNRIKPENIITYLKSINWEGDTSNLEILIPELKKYVNRITLHFGINDRVNSNIGIECSIKSDSFNNGDKWSNFLDYLSDKGLCTIKEKKKVLKFIGSDINKEEINFENYNPIVKTDNSSSIALVRYISHVKISYSLDGKLKAKAYPGVRLFGKE
jgi:hypothetical protein